MTWWYTNAQKVTNLLLETNKHKDTVLKPAWSEVRTLRDKPPNILTRRYNPFLVPCMKPEQIVETVCHN